MHLKSKKTLEFCGLAVVHATAKISSVEPLLMVTSIARPVNLS